MKNMRVAKKMLVSFAVVLLLSVLLGVVAILMMGNIDDASNSIVTYELPGLQYIGQINAALRGERSELRAMLLAREHQNDGRYADAKAKLESNIADVEDNIALCGPTLRTENGKATFAQIESGYGEYSALRDSYLATVEAGDLEAAYTELTELSEPIERVLDAGDKLLGLRLDSAKTSSEAATSTYRTGLFIVIGALAVVLILSVALSLYLTRIISTPLTKMAAVLNQIGKQGDLGFSDELMANMRRDGQYKDEIGQSVNALHSMVTHMTYIGDEMGYMARGDLSRTVERLSERDSMGNAMNGLLQNVNGMFADIGASAVEVADGAHQISNGAQALAQGATEQASSVEELSASIADVAGALKSAAENATHASALADTIHEKAEQGSAQMTRMMEAVHAISEASNNIGKVMAVIDNIAFQTNILALNASVEAARVGAQGRGFAVVAEEVRALANKSAEAAKDTGALIENSITKAGQGVEIATATSGSLKEIVAGIAESNAVIGEIAHSATQQSASIEQINIGVDQVAQVVQHNSATAQESAAASQEMSAQAKRLQDLIGQFKLNEATAAKGGPEPVREAPKPRPDAPPPPSIHTGMGKY